MGYRSHVVYGIKGPKDVMVSFIANLKLKHPEVSKALDECTLLEEPCYFEGETHPEYILGLDEPDTKWYDSYPGVQMHTLIFDFAKCLADNEPEVWPLDGAFVRIGEEPGDIETQTFGDDPEAICYPVSAIESNYDFSKSNDIRKSQNEPASAPA